MKVKVDLMMFDFDGTLVDSKDDIAASVNYLLGKLGREPEDVGLIAGCIGDGIHTLLRRVLGRAEDAPVDEEVTIFREHYWEHCLDRTKDFPGVRHTLEHFEDKIKAVVTNKPRQFAERMLQGLDLARYFRVVVGGDGAYARKPSPEGFLAVLQQTGIEPGRALVIGDSVNDVRGGRAARCLTCAVTYGLGDREALRAADPDMMVDSIEELIGLVE